MGASLYMWVYRGFPLVGALSSNEWSLPLNETLGIGIPSVTMRRFVFVHDPAVADFCKDGHRQRVLQHRFDLREDLASEISYRWSDTVPGGVTVLWEKFRRSVFCTTARTEEYLEWRFVNTPFMKYRFLELSDADGLQAIAVARFQDTPHGSVCRIVDFMANPDRGAAAWAATAVAARESGAVFSDFLVIGDCQDRALLQAGFLPADSETGLNGIPQLLSPIEHREWTATFHMGGRLARKETGWRNSSAVYFTKADSDRDWPTSYDVARQGE